MSLKVSGNSQENTYSTVSFLIKLQASDCNIINIETLTQVFALRVFLEHDFNRTPPGNYFRKIAENVIHIFFIVVPTKNKASFVHNTSP